MASLIKQRMDIDRRILVGKWFLVIGSLLFAGGILGVIFLPPWGPAFALLYGAVGIGYGVFSLLRGRRALASFEKENGVGAGVQQPVRVPGKRPR